MDEELLQSQQKYITSSIDFFILYYSTKNESHFSLSRLFIEGHSLECILKAVYIERKSSLPTIGHRLDSYLEELHEDLFTDEEKEAYDKLYGEGFNQTKNFDLGLHEQYQQATELLLITDYLKDLKYGIDLEGKGIIAVQTTSLPVNEKFIEVYKKLIGLIKREDLNQIIEISLSKVYDQETKKYFTDLLLNK